VSSFADEIIHLRNAGTWSGGGTPSKATADFWDNGDIPWVSPKDMKTFELHDSQDKITAKAVEASPAKLVPAGSVLMVVRSGILAHTFPVAIARRPVTLNQDMKAITPKAGLSAEFLAYQLRAQASTILNSCTKSGTTVASVETKQLQALPIWVPSTELQSKIVEELDKQLSRLGATVTTLKGIQAKLKQARASILKAAVEGRLVERAMNNKQRFPVLSVGDICSTKPTNGRSVPTLDGGFPVLRLTAMKGGQIDFAEMKGGVWSEEEAAKWIIEEGDFFVMRGNGSIKRVGDGAIAKQVPCKVAYPDTMIRIRADPERLDSRYLLHLWRSPLLRSQIESAAKTTAGIFKINQRDIAIFRLPIPTLGEQREIVAEVDRRFSVLDQVEATVTTSLARCSKLRQAILKQAFEGRLVPVA
jgi:type I restriction enzyme S subunit